MKYTNIAKFIVALCFTALIIYYVSNTDQISQTALFRKNISSQINKEEVHHKDHSHSHECIHDKIRELEEKQKEELNWEQSYKKDDVSYQMPQENDYRNIRIKFDYSNLERHHFSVQQYIEKNLIPAAGNYFEELLQVRRLTAPIKLSTAYRSQKCGQAQIKVPQSHIDQGVNADFIFYISATDDPDQNFLAYASNCDTQGRSAEGRPLAGYFNMNLRFFKEAISSSNKMQVAQWIWTTLHEMSHSLVFSLYHFKNFRGQPVKTDQYGRTIFADQATVDYARQYFKCSSMQGVPLEDQGGPGSKGSHWERRILGNEMMTASSLYDAVFSQFTLLVYNASGWYKVNWNKAQTLVWGRDEGCNFVGNNCDYQSQEFCNLRNDGCTYDYSAVGSCREEPFSNNCKYSVPYSNTQCNYPQGKMGEYWQKLGGAYGPNTRCFKSTLFKNMGFEAGCLESSCVYSGNQVIVKFKAFGQEYQCNKSGEVISVRRGQAQVTCPDLVRFCQHQASCPDSCLGRGTCFNSKCVCHKGFTGTSCEQTM